MRETAEAMIEQLKQRILELEEENKQEKGRLQTMGSTTADRQSLLAQIQELGG